MCDDYFSKEDREYMLQEWLHEIKYEASHGDEYAMMALSDYYDQFDTPPDHFDDIDWCIWFFSECTDNDFLLDKEFMRALREYEQIEDFGREELDCESHFDGAYFF